MNVLRRVLTDQDALKKFIDSYVAERRRLVSDIAKQRRRTETNLAKAVTSRDRMVKYLIEGTISKEAYLKERDELERRVAIAETELARVAPAPAVDLHPAAVTAYKGRSRPAK